VPALIPSHRNSGPQHLNRIGSHAASMPPVIENDPMMTGVRKPPGKAKVQLEVGGSGG